MHTDEEYRAFDNWVGKSAQIDFGLVNKLKNDPEKAREEIRTKVLELFMGERTRLEGQGQNPNKANSIDGWADLIFSPQRSSKVPSGGEGRLFDTMDDIDSWTTLKSQGQQWDENLGVWGMDSLSITEEERELVRSLPFSVPIEQTEKDFIFENIPWESRGTRISVDPTVQEILVGEYGPKWRTSSNLRLKKVFTRQVDSIQNALESGFTPDEITDNYVEIVITKSLKK